MQSPLTFFILRNPLDSFGSRLKGELHAQVCERCWGCSWPTFKLRKVAGTFTHLIWSDDLPDEINCPLEEILLSKCLWISASKVLVYNVNGCFDQMSPVKANTFEEVTGQCPKNCSSIFLFFIPCPQIKRSPGYRAKPKASYLTQILFNIKWERCLTLLHTQMLLWFHLDAFAWKICPKYAS